MTHKGSYQIKTISVDMEKEINRLKAQVDLFWDKELKHYIEFGLKDGIKVVELGSGPGFVIERLLKTFRKIHVTGLEIEPLLNDYAKNYLLGKKRFKRCTLVEGSIMKTGFPDNSFDFAVTRLVLEHLADPVEAVREIYRILKPGGKAVFIDNDFEMHIMTYQNIPELRELYDAYCKSRYDEGGNPKIGRELPRILKDGGLRNIDFEVISAHSELLGDEMFFQSEGIGIPMRLLKDGYLSSEMLGRISLKWRDMIRHKDHQIIRQLYMAVGEKEL